MLGAGEGARQRSRVGSPLQPSSAAGSLTAPPGSPSAPSGKQQQAPAAQQLHLLPQAQKAPQIGASVQLRPAEPAASYSRVPVPPAPPPAAPNCNHAVPEPPAPRCWTPSKLSNGSAGGSCARGGASGGGGSPRCMTPGEALEQEMQELCCVDPAAAVVQQRTQSCTSGCVGKGGQPGGADGGARRPASSGHAPCVQHSNLVGASRPHSSSSGGSSAARDDSWSSQLGLTKLRGMRDKLAGLGAESSSTAVEEFHEPSAGPVVVAKRRGTAPARLLPSGGHHCSRSAAQWEQECAALLNVGDRLAALQLPGPSNGVVKCYIKRTSNLLGLAPLFELRLEATDELLAVARRRVAISASCYDISLSSGSSSGGSTPSSSPSFHGGSAASSISGMDDTQLVGKLKANMLGTEYLLRGRGGDHASHKGFNAQLLAVNYKPTINHIQAAPRTTTAVIPIPESQSWGGSNVQGQYDSLTACMEAARKRQLPLSYERELVMLHTMQPHYDAVKQVHYLDFKGRVTEVSGKNFQLVHWDHNRNQLGTDLVLLFGKKGHGEYAADFCYPMTPLQAFALGLSSIDTKLCYAM